MLVLIFGGALLAIGLLGVAVARALIELAEQQRLSHREVPPVRRFRTHD